MTCIFCNIVKKEAPSWMIYQDESISAFFDYFPASKGHLLIVPNQHYANLFEMPDDLLAKISSLSKKIAVFYKENMGVEHLNIIQSNGKFAGQEVFHYHMHLVPRSENDTVNFHWKHHEELRNEYDDLKKYISEAIN